MSIVDVVQLKGIAKTWLYNNYIISYITWPLLIYEFPPSYSNIITATVVRHIKKWLNIHRSANIEYLFLPIPGLGLTHPTIHLKSMQVVKHMLLKESTDVRSNFIAQQNLTIAEESKNRRWRPEITAMGIEKELR